MNTVAFVAALLALPFAYTYPSEEYAPLTTATNPVYSYAEHSSDNATATVTRIAAWTGSGHETTHETESVVGPYETVENEYATRTGGARESGESTQYTLPVETIYSYITGAAPTGVDVETTIIGTKTVTTLPSAASVISSGLDGETHYIVPTDVPSKMTESAGATLFSTVTVHRSAATPSDGVSRLTKYIKPVQVLVGSPITTSMIVALVHSKELSVTLTTVTESASLSTVLVPASDSFVAPPVRIVSPDTSSTDSSSSAALISPVTVTVSGVNITLPASTVVSATTLTRSGSITTLLGSTITEATTITESEPGLTLTGPTVVSATTITGPTSTITLPASTVVRSSTIEKTLDASTVVSVTTIEEMSVSFVSTLETSTVVAPTTIRQTEISTLNVTVPGKISTVPTTVHDVFTSLVSITGSGTTLVSPTTIHKIDTSIVSVILPEHTTMIPTTVRDTVVSRVNETSPPSTILQTTTATETVMSVFNELMPEDIVLLPTTVKETYISFHNRTVMSMATQTVTYTKPCRLCSEGVSRITTTKFQPIAMVRPTTATVHDTLTINKTLLSISYATNTATVNSFVTNNATSTRSCSTCTGYSRLPTTTQVSSNIGKPSQKSTFIWESTSDVMATSYVTNQCTQWHHWECAHPTIATSVRSHRVTSNVTASCITYPPITTTQTVTASRNNSMTTRCNTFTVPGSTGWTRLPPPKTTPGSTATSRNRTRTWSTASTVWATSCSVITSGNTTSTKTHSVPYTTTSCHSNSTSMVPQMSSPSSGIVWSTTTEHVTATHHTTVIPPVNTTTPCPTGRKSSTTNKPTTLPVLPQNFTLISPPPGTVPTPPSSTSPIQPVTYTKSYESHSPLSESVPPPVETQPLPNPPHEPGPVQSSPVSPATPPEETIPVPPYESSPVPSSPIAPVTPPSMTSSVLTGATSNAGEVHRMGYTFTLVIAGLGYIML